MSISLMSAIFETEFRDLPTGEGDQMAKASSLKIVMLAIADHANDEGESAYPGMKKLVRKTGLSKQGLINVLTACKYNGLLYVSAEPSRLGTNNYTIELSCYPILQGKDEDRLVVKSLDQSSHLTTSGKATLPPLVKPLDHNHPLTTIKPSLSERKEKAKERIKEQRANRKDLAEGMIELAQMPGVKRSVRLDGILSRIAVRLSINPSGRKWQDFIRFVDDREQEGQSLDVFMDWLISQKGFDVSYWPPSKMEEHWPRAFSEQEVASKSHAL